MNLIEVPLAFEARPIRPTIDTIAVFLATAKVPSVAGAIRAGLVAFPVLEVVFPVALVLVTIYMFVDPVTVGLVLSELSLVNISRWMKVLPLPLSLPVFPVALVSGPIMPCENPVAVPD
jgi:hypothetical protein